MYGADTHHAHRPTDINVRLPQWRTGYIISAATSDPPNPFCNSILPSDGGENLSSSARGAKTGSSGAPEPRLFRQDGRLRIVSSAQCGSTTETRRDLAVRTSRAVVLSVDPRAAGITQHHSVILALCKPATAVATTRTLHYPSHSSRRRRGNPWSQVSRRPPATTHPLQKTDSIDRLPRSAGQRRAWRTRSACCASVWTLSLEAVLCRRTHRSGYEAACARLAHELSSVRALRGLCLRVGDGARTRRARWRRARTG